MEVNIKFEIMGEQDNQVINLLSIVTKSAKKDAIY